MQIEETAAAEVFELMADLATLEEGDIEAMAAIENRRHALRFPNPDDTEALDDVPL
jgi:hypothetical protein